MYILSLREYWLTLVVERKKLNTVVIRMRFSRGRQRHCLPYPENESLSHLNQQTAVSNSGGKTNKKIYVTVM